MKIHHDGKFDIATGKSRKEENWKNTQLLWSDLLLRLSVTHRTAEKFDEYINAKKDRQAEIKDVGGFVGGYLVKGKRRSGSVMHRQVLTLDLDFAHADMWDDFCMLYNNAACIYTTHKHCPEIPRFRLVIPLDREVTADEYEPIGRRIAGSIGIEDFDAAGFRASQLMYWPSTAKDGEYIFKHQDGPWLSADTVLNSYRDWRDASEWPMSSREKEIPLRAIKKQGDPLEKPGVIGAFCRTYSISEAIDKFLPDVYEKCDVEDRYSYVEGSTAAGLVVYEDKYTYSHHGTDPISGKLCNSFDLVRLHKFGLRDEDARDGAKVTELPSYKEMIVFACADSSTSKTLSVEKLAETEDDFPDFEDDIPDGQPVNDDWLSDLKKDKQGKTCQTIDNVILVLDNDPVLKGKFYYNEFEGREVTRGKLPWRHKNNTALHLSDTDDAGLRHYLEKRYDLSSPNKIKDGFDIVIRKNSFHPVREYLSVLEWDGEERLETLLSDYLGAEDTIYVRTVTRKALIAAVARIYEPGIKFDNMLIIVGDQGIGKSTILAKIGGRWFSDSFNFHMLSSKQGEEQLRGAWLIEVGELTGLSKADVDSAKSFLARGEDRYRVAYGKRLDYFPRQCIFFGTTNSPRPLKDSSGNRRFWPVITDGKHATLSVFTDLTKEIVDQIWAEAKYYYDQKEVLILSAEVKEMAENVQRDHTEFDEIFGQVQDYLGVLLPEKWVSMDVWHRREWLQSSDELEEAGTEERTHVSAAEIWCEVMGGTVRDMTKVNMKRVHEVMQQMPGWEMGKRTKRLKYYGTQRVYERVRKIVKRGVNEVVNDGLQKLIES